MMNWNKRRGSWGRRLLSAVLSLLLAAGPVLPAAASAAEAGAAKLSLDNGYILAELTGKHGCFDIRTVVGDKVNKDDNNKNLLFPSGDDPTSFTSFQVTRGGTTKEYIFGGSYPGSSEVSVQQTANELTAVWSVDGLTFTQTLRLINSGSNEHGMVYLSYGVENAGAPAQIKARVLLDTALGNQDHAYYRVGTQLIESETALGQDGYNKSFYCYDDPQAPKITAYLVNASLNDRECKPYQTIFAHWNNLAATAFDYTPDPDMTFTNFQNKKYLTADSACALYYDLGRVEQGASGAVALNYGVYSNEKVTSAQTATVNVTAPDAMTLTSDSKAYEKGGKFTVTTAVKNIGSQSCQKARIVLYTTGALQALDENGQVIEATYDKPYYREVNDFVPGQTQTITWNLQATPQAEGVYAAANFKVYDVSDSATQGTGALLADNLLGEGSAWVLCPGSVSKVPQIQFTGSSPEVLYSSGVRTLYVTGKNFSMLSDTGEYSLMLSRVDAQAWNGHTEVAIPANKVYLDAGKNTLTVTLDDETPGQLPEGQYQLTVDYTDPTKPDLSAPALRFAVKQEEKYRNETYGLLVAVKSGNGGSSEYSVRTYPSETAYQAALQSGALDREDALLEFRGVFTRRSMDGVTVYTGVSSGSDDNVMTLNSCLDIESGAVTVTEKEGNVSVDFDASIYTTGSRTSVWKGVAALTELEMGKDYGLIQYKENGDRQAAQPDSAITLLWPSVGQGAQNLLGFLMEFKYGELGVIHHDGGAETRVVGFGAAMDLSFIIPSFHEKVDNRSLLGDAYNAALHGGAGHLTAAELRALNRQIPYNVDTVNTNATAGDAAEEDDGYNTISGSIQVDDVLFGGGFLGVNMAVSMAVPAYIEGTPSLAGTLTLKTVGDWSVGVAGSCDFSAFCMEGEISIKSKDNIPVPDSIHFFLGNCTPGICLDPCGVLWIQGAGGGIENLYDTIFLTDSVPPLKLILDAQFSLMQVISAKASLSLSLRGIGVTLTDGKVANVVPVMESARLQVDWYPEFFFLSSVNMDVAGIIKGGGYIVVEESGFFEFFVKASVQVPEDIMIIGGMDVASVGLGANAEKLWGQLEALGVSLGVVYYWGGSLEWGGGASAQPTYPSLLTQAVYQDLPVYTNSATGQTLYAAVGTNLSLSAAAGPGMLQAAPSGAGHSLTTAGDGQSFGLFLSEKTKDELLLVEWSAASREAALEDVENITIRDENDIPKEIKLLDHTKSVDVQADANANLTFNAQTGTATLAISFTEGAEFGSAGAAKAWMITAPMGANVVLYDLEPMPELTGATAAVNNGRMTVTVAGTGLEKFDAVNFIAVPKAGGDAALLYRATKPADSGAIAASQAFPLPADLSSGDYELRVVADDQQGQYHAEVSTNFSHINLDAPHAPAGVTAVCAGDYRLNVTAAGPELGAFDGYRVDVYDVASGEEVPGVSGALFTRDGRSVEYKEDGTLALPQGNTAASATMTVGGQYQFRSDNANGNPTGAANVLGLEADHTYRIDVSTWRQIGAGAAATLLYSPAASSNEVLMQKKVDLTFDFTAAGQTPVDVTETHPDGNRGQLTFTTPTYKSADLELTAVTTSAVAGSWKLDGKALSGDQASTADQVTYTLRLADLAQGVHTLEFTGKNIIGDTVRTVYPFGVDTLPPRLLLSSPKSGSFYDDAAGVSIQGVTDRNVTQNVTLTVTDTTTGKSYGPFSVTADAEGRFAQSVALDPGLASHTLDITATDAVGNATVRTVDLLNAGLGDIDALSIYSGETDITNTSVLAGQAYPLTLVAKLGTGGRMELNDDTLVEWRQSGVSGGAALAWENGAYTLTTGQSDRGMVTAYLLGNDLGGASAVFAYGPAPEEPSDPPSPPPSESPTVTPSESPTATPSESPTATPSESPTATPSESPTATPSESPTATPSESPTASPSESPTATPSESPTASPSESPTASPSESPTASPSESPTASPSESPTASPSESPTASPTVSPSESPSPAKPSRPGRGSRTDRGEQALPPACPKDETCPAHSFADLDPSLWYHDGIHFCVEHELMKGASATAFQPAMDTSRAMIATILWRLRGSPVVNYALPYPDVPGDAWYTEAVRWAASEGVVKGYATGSFGPDDPITREQLALMLYRYEQKYGQGGFTGNWMFLLDFDDREKVSQWAYEALCWMTMNQVITGKGAKTLDPLGKATRAEVATMLMRYAQGAEK